jgi:hypothetical protein
MTRTTSGPEPRAIDRDPAAPLAAERVDTQRNVG